MTRKVTQEKKIKPRLTGHPCPVCGDDLVHFYPLEVGAMGRVSCTRSGCERNTLPEGVKLEGL
jgi:hypothetical protein